MPTVPRTNGCLVNSAGSLTPEPPVPLPFGIAGLRHEALDHPVEHQAVVEALAGQLLDSRDVFRREIGAQFDHHHAVLQRQEQGVSGSGAAAAVPGDSIVVITNPVTQVRTSMRAAS